MTDQSSTTPTTRARLRVDPIACDGIGMCAHTAPGLITLDRWGFPLLAGDSVENADGDDLRELTTAAAACPRRALFIERSR